jgi:hypothetical protein
LRIACTYEVRFSCVLDSVCQTCAAICKVFDFTRLSLEVLQQLILFHKSTLDGTEQLSNAKSIYRH